MPSRISTTGIRVSRLRISPRMLLCLELKCWMTTKPMPPSGGMLEKKVSRASRPPAEAPMPTTGNLVSSSFLRAGLSFWFWLGFSWFAFFLMAFSLIGRGREQIRWEIRISQSRWPRECMVFIGKRNIFHPNLHITTTGLKTKLFPLSGTRLIPS